MLDTVLQSLILQLSISTFIVNLSAIQSKKLYIISVTYLKIQSEQLND